MHQTSKLPKYSSALRFSYSLFLIAVFISPIFIPVKATSSVEKIVTESLPTIKKTISESINPSQVVHFTYKQIVDSIQQSRRSIGLLPLVIDDQSCKLSESLIDLVEAENKLTAANLEVFCDNCIHKAYITTLGNYSIPDSDPWMTTQDITSLTQDDLTHMCVFAKEERVLVLLGKVPQESPAQEVATKEVSPVNFTSEQLWQAFIDYRHAHTKSDLQYSTNLCSYASKRVEEHILMFAQKPMSEYENQDKYPLDAHAGFSRDGDSGYLFDATGFNVVAENLAYWPSAQSPNQVIEWGWDTSTEGHREAQLSEEYSHACIMGRSGFYVAIFATN